MLLLGVCCACNSAIALRDRWPRRASEAVTRRPPVGHVTNHIRSAQTAPSLSIRRGSQAETGLQASRGKERVHIRSAQTARARATRFLLHGGSVTVPGALATPAPPPPPSPSPTPSTDGERGFRDWCVRACVRACVFVCVCALCCACLGDDGEHVPQQALVVLRRVAQLRAKIF